MTVEEVRRWQRDLFGSGRPAGTRRLFDRDEPKDRIYAVGGWGASGDGLQTDALELEGSR